MIIRMRFMNHYDIKGHQHEVHLTTIIYACLLYHSIVALVLLRFQHLILGASYEYFSDLIESRSIEVISSNATSN